MVWMEYIRNGDSMALIQLAYSAVHVPFLLSSLGLPFE